jgi:hypothetical protein
MENGSYCKPKKFATNQNLAFWRITTILHFFSSVAHVWVPGAKTTGPIAKKFVFSFNFFGSEKFQVSAQFLPK